MTTIRVWCDCGDCNTESELVGDFDLEDLLEFLKKNGSVNIQIADEFGAFYNDEDFDNELKVRKEVNKILNNR